MWRKFGEKKVYEIIISKIKRMHEVGKYYNIIVINHNIIVTILLIAHIRSVLIKHLNRIFGMFVMVVFFFFKQYIQLQWCRNGVVEKQIVNWDVGLPNIYDDIRERGRLRNEGGEVRERARIRK